MYKLYESSRTKKSGRTSTNLYLQLKWDIFDYENHRYNIRTAKSRVDNRAPRTFPHIYYKPKKLQLELERFCAIQRNNKFLMDRLATIQREGGWIDHHNYHEIKSLNTWKRQQEMIELAYNNQALLHRLLDCQSRYNHNKLEDEYMLTRKRKANVEKFPEDWRKIKFQMRCMRKRMREKVISMRTGKGKLSLLSEEDEQAAIEREALEMQEAEGRKRLETQRATEAEERERVEKSESLKVIRERRRAMADWKEASKQWRRAREERLRLIEERKRQEERKLAEIREREERKERERREETRKKLEKWRKWKAENEQSKETSADEPSSGTRDRRGNETTPHRTVAKSQKKKPVKKEMGKKVPTDDSLDMKTVYLEGGEKVAKIEKEIVDDLNADIIPTEAEQDAPKEEGKHSKTVVEPEVDQKVGIEEDIIEDPRAEDLRKTDEEQVASELEATSSSQTAHLEESEEAVEVEKDMVDDIKAEPTEMVSEEAPIKEGQPTVKVVFEGGEKEEEIEEEIVEDLRANVFEAEDIPESEELSIASSTIEDNSSDSEVDLDSVEDEEEIEDLVEEDFKSSVVGTETDEISLDEISGKIIESEQPTVKDVLEKVLMKEITEDESSISETEEIFEPKESKSMEGKSESLTIGPTESEEKYFEAVEDFKSSSVNNTTDDHTVISKSDSDNESNIDPVPDVS